MKNLFFVLTLLALSCVLIYSIIVLELIVLEPNTQTRPYVEKIAEGVVHDAFYEQDDQKFAFITSRLGGGTAIGQKYWNGQSLRYGDCVKIWIRIYDPLVHSNNFITGSTIVVLPDRNIAPCEN